MYVRIQHIHTYRRLTFDREVSIVEEKLNRLHNVLKIGCECVSEGLMRSVLALIVKIGNYVNCNTKRQLVYGISMSSLESLKQIKSIDGKVTFIKLVAEHIDNQMPSAWAQLEWLNQCHDASEISLDDLLQQIGQLEYKIKNIQQELLPSDAQHPNTLHTSKEIAAVDETFTRAFTPFTQNAMQTIAQLKSRLQETHTFLSQLGVLFADKARTPADALLLLRQLGSFGRELLSSHRELQLRREQSERKRNREILRASTPGRVPGMASARSGSRHRSSLQHLSRKDTDDPSSESIGRSEALKTYIDTHLPAGARSVTDARSVTEGKSPTEPRSEGDRPYTEGRLTTEGKSLGESRGLMEHRGVETGRGITRSMAETRLVQDNRSTGSRTVDNRLLAERRSYAEPRPVPDSVKLSNFDARSKASTKFGETAKFAERDHTLPIKDRRNSVQERKDDNEELKSRRSVPSTHKSRRSPSVKSRGTTVLTSVVKTYTHIYAHYTHIYYTQKQTVRMHIYVFFMAERSARCTSRARSRA